MSNATKIILIIVGGCLLIASIILYFVFEDKIWPAPGSNQKIEVQGPSGSLGLGGGNVNAPIGGSVKVEAPKVETPKPLTAEEKSKNDLSRLAKSFAERFGSYSNSSDFENLRDLEPFMTSTMVSWSEKFIREKKSALTNAAYYGIMTTVVSQEVSSFSNNEAIVLLHTQRTENNSAGENKIFYQDLKLQFEKSNNIWLIDAAYWQ